MEYPLALVDQHSTVSFWSVHDWHRPGFDKVLTVCALLRF